MKKLFLSDKIVLLAIIANAIVLFFLSYPHLTHHHGLLMLDYGFTVYFIGELLVKWRTYGLSYYKNDWLNRFDMFIVIASSLSILALILPIPNLSYLLMLRLLRLVRLVSFMRIIPNMAKILEGLGRALKASVFVIVALFLYNFMLAVVSTQLFHEKAPEYFGTPLISMYTVFQLFTTEGWIDVADALSKGESPLYTAFVRGFQIFIVLSGGIFGLSLANAIFVDEMTIDNNQALEEKIEALTEEMRKMREEIGG